MIFFGCWPFVTKITHIQAKFSYVYALFNIHVQYVHSMCLIKCPNNILLLFWTPMSTKFMGITIIIHVYHVLIIGGVFYIICPVSVYSCISHASFMHTRCTLLHIPLTLDMFCIHSCSLNLSRPFSTYNMSLCLYHAIGLHLVPSSLACHTYTMLCSI